MLLKREELQFNEDNMNLNTIINGSLNNLLDESIKEKNEFTDAVADIKHGNTAAAIVTKNIPQALATSTKSAILNAAPKSDPGEEFSDKVIAAKDNAVIGAKLVGSTLKKLPEVAATELDRNFDKGVRVASNTVAEHPGKVGAAATAAIAAGLGAKALINKLRKSKPKK